MATISFAHGAIRRTPQRLLYGLLLCSMAFALLLTFCFAARLQAEENIPTALGSIGGVITDQNGQPVSGVQVSLFTNYPYSSWYEARRVTTETDGSYRFPALPVGVYRVGVNRPQTTYAPSFYPAATNVQQAGDIPLTGNQLMNINLTLQPSGRIVVTVTATQNLTVTYSYVEVRRRIETPVGTQWDYAAYSYIENTNGVYTITGLAAETYRVCATGYGPDLSAYECYDNVYAVEQATDLVLTAGATISNVAIVLGDGASYGQIPGRATANDATPLDGINVYAIAVPAEEVAAAAHPRATDVGLLSRQAMAPVATRDIYYGYTFTRTNALGEYQLLTLAAGKYKLQFTDPDGNYAFEYYNNTFAENVTQSSR
ncbi:MAG: carboxypeptidase-like regulatory domain-containing protein [Caldilineaceae bacterium]